ncbi:condensation domain-containing protein [Actinomadura fulvescens]|uniref:Condensation domain-containing protein n=1 Tax=Actinomadura fulvescens TaxID=46160 RepID=A0ABP6D7Q0_9ACTN
MRLSSIDDFTPEPGRLVEWTARAGMVTGASPDPAPPSYSQRFHIDWHRANVAGGARPSSWLTAVFDLPGPLDAEAMAAALEHWVRRHPTLLTWFRMDDGRPQRYAVRSADFSLAPVAVGTFDSGAGIRDFLQRQFDSRIDPLTWPPFVVAAIDRADSATLLFAVDHTHTDGYSLIHIFSEVRALYEAERAGTRAELPEVGSYVDYCASEVTRAAEITGDSSSVGKWLEFAHACGGTPPGFPLDLGLPPGGRAPGVSYAMELFDETKAGAFNAACVRAGARFSGGLLAALGIANQRLAGQEHYRGLMTLHTRTEPRWLVAQGWFTNLVPVQFPVAGASTFADLLPRAQLALLRAAKLNNVPFHWIAPILAEKLNLLGDPRSVVPMTSYIDVRRAPASKDFEAARFQVVAGHSEFDEVFIWINRDWHRTTFTAVHPDTSVARQNVHRYAELVRGVLREVADKGDAPL